MTVSQIFGSALFTVFIGKVKSRAYASVGEKLGMLTFGTVIVRWQGIYLRNTRHRSDTSRTGVSIEPETYAKLADHPNIYAIKEANGNISKIVETAALVGDKLDIYSGNDDQIVPIMACGGKGVISVLSNVIPKETVELCQKFFDGDVAGAMELQKKYLPLTNALFCEVNPIPVKAATAATSRIGSTDS